MHQVGTHDFRLIQDGPRSYRAERWEFQRWWVCGRTELLDTYEGTIEDAMREDFDAVVNPRVETVDELRDRLFREFGAESWARPLHNRWTVDRLFRLLSDFNPEGPGCHTCNSTNPLDADPTRT